MPVSGWNLARSVARLGQLGVISGTGLAVVMARKLQLGDADGHLRNALSQFPIPGVAERILAKYYIAGGKHPNAPFKADIMPKLSLGKGLTELTVAANFAEVFLAKQGHDGLVGINLLEKIQMPNLASLYGAMLAGVDYVLMGAGLPLAIPGALDNLALGRAATLKVDVEQALPGDDFRSVFEPSEFFQGAAPPLKRPHFLGVVASTAAAVALVKKANGKVDGFVVEGDTAGGHNAPPRGSLQLSASGEPVYGPRDVPDIDKIGELGLPFWLAGSYGQPGKLLEARSLGAAGTQVGTAFAFCDESGLEPELKRRVLQLSRDGGAGVFTEPLASPTGFPFKVVTLDATLSHADRYQARQHICDLGYLRHLYRKVDGQLGHFCPSEPVDEYLEKGGVKLNTEGRKCLCNALLANIGIGQIRADGLPEPALLTAGNDVANVARFLGPGTQSYSASDVMRQLLASAQPTTNDENRE